MTFDDCNTSITHDKNKKENYIHTVHYRNQEIDIYDDDYGQQFYCEIDGKTIGFGSFNTEYMEDLKYIIDAKLDTIYTYEDLKNFGARIEYFNNAGYRDIRLVYRQRILKVYISTDDKEITDDIKREIIKDADKILAAIVR